ncbi:MAG: SurA N-terminal domain-containing protein [Lysobacterales bacterium]
MLQRIRDTSSSKFFYITLLVLIVGGLLFFGIGDYSFGGARTYVAKVGSEYITEQVFQSRMDEQRRRMRGMLRDAYNPRMFETIEFKRQLLDQLIDEELVTQAGAAAGLAIGDTRLREEIAKIEGFSVDGNFDRDRYLLALQSSGFTPQTFEQRMRRDLAVAELPSQIMATTLVTDHDLAAFVRLRDQTRDFRRLELAAVAADPSAISDEQARNYYQAHVADFNTPEQVSVEYVEIDGATLVNDQPISEDELRQHYDEQLARFATREQRLASHILIEVPANADAETEKAAADKAAGLAAEIAAGKEFAAVARASSDDIGSRATGGDLGWIETGMMEPAFEAALYALAPGAVSEPVHTDQGYHLIQLREVKAGATKPFEEVRAQLEQELRAERHAEQFAELEDKLLTAAGTASGTLEPLAVAIGTKVQTSALFSRDMGDGIALNPAVRDAAFSPEVKEDGLSSEPIELAKDRLVVLRLAEHKPVTPKSYEQVKDGIVAQLAREAAETQARSAADALFKRLLAGATMEALAPEVSGTVIEAASVGRDGLSLDRKLVESVFKMARPAAGAVTPGLAELAGNRFALVELSAVHDGELSVLDEEGRKSAREQLRQGLSMLEVDAFRKALRARIPVTVNEDRL